MYIYILAVLVILIVLTLEWPSHCQIKYIAVSLTDLIRKRLHSSQYSRGMVVLSLLCLPFMESSQIICCYSHVAEKIQEALPHQKIVK